MKTRAIWRAVCLLGSLLPYVGVVKANQTDEAQELARNLFSVAAECHDHNDYDCAIENYSRSLRTLEKTKTIVRLAWVCLEKFDSLARTDSASVTALQCANNFYPRAMRACDNSNIIWDDKGKDCERTRRQYPYLLSAQNEPLSSPPSASTYVAPSQPPQIVPFSPPREALQAVPLYRNTGRVNDARNLRIAGIVIGCIGLAGAGIGVGLSQATQPDQGRFPADNGYYRWTAYDFVTLGGASVALLGGSLWLAGKIMRPRIVLTRPYALYR